MAYLMTNEAWLAAGFLPRRFIEEDPLDALRGVATGAVLSVLLFWMPLAIALAR
ncbi:MAG: hypothetical protein ABI533_07470 [Betaproteobacteria bacterium]